MEKKVSTCAAMVLALTTVYASWAAEPEPQPRDHIGHTRHHHRHNPPHPTVGPGTRFVTNRNGAPLKLPVEDDAFFFAVFGDRTGGPATGVSVLADAVRDTNLLEPDLVMTVGDLVQGYNQAPAWLDQMREFKSIMDQLLCPWFPVAGNHDTYWRGPKQQKPEGEHDERYEMHFGPLWYAFAHKNCWFIALYSDEGNPETGEKNFHKPDCQRMSPEQFNWLADVLDKAADADHVFLFLHHPRWLKNNYGDDWDRVHSLLVEAGNVSAVFAGHIHHMRSDPRDGIEYVTLATVGGGQRGTVPSTGYLHEFHIVTVRKQQLAISAVPVGEIMDVREITGAMQEECVKLVEQVPAIEASLHIGSNGEGSGEMRATLANTSSRPVAMTATLEAADSHWRTLPDHDHVTLDPGATHTFGFNVSRTASTLDDTYQPLEFVTQMEYLTSGYRYPLPERRIAVPVAIDLPTLPVPADEHVLQFDGHQGHLPFASERVGVPDGPLTLECWMRAHRFGRRVGLVTKTESSDYGIFVSHGQPSFSVFLGDGYIAAKGPEGMLKADRWYHIAGVYDGARVRLYVDGELVEATEGHGARRMNKLPLMVGADVNSQGQATSHFDGAIDELRLSAGARYQGERFSPQRRLTPDDSTFLLLHADGTVGQWVVDDSQRANHVRLAPGAAVVPVLQSN